MADTTTRIYELQVKLASDSLRSLQAIQNSAKKTEQSLKSVQSAFGMVGLGFSSAMIVGEVVQMADAFNELQARLKLVTGSSEAAAEAMNNISGIAERTRSSMQDVGTLYARTANAMKQMGISQGTISKTTEAFASALKISGASATEAGSAILQFSQALGSGVLAGEEFRAIAESSPRFMQALRDSLGKTTAELREMSKEGKLTSDVVVGALLGSFDKLQKEMKDVPLTISGAFTLLKNELFSIIGAIDDATDTSGNAARSFLELGRIGIQAFTTLGTTVIWMSQVLGIAAATITEIGVGISQMDFTRIGNAVALNMQMMGEASEKAGGALNKIYEGQKKVAEQTKVQQILAKSELQMDKAKLQLDAMKKKAAKDAEEAAKKAIKDAEAQKKAYDNLMESMDEQIALLDAENAGTEKLTSAEKYLIKIQSDLNNGTLKLTKSQQQNYEIKKLAIQAANEKAKADAAEMENLKRLGIEAEEALKQEQKMQDLVNSFTGNSRVTIERMQQERDMIGMREKQKQVLIATRKLEDDAQKARDQAYDNLEGKAYADAINGINEKLIQQQAELQRTTEDVYDYSTSWEAGAKTAFASYADEVSNYAKTTEQLVSDSFRGMEDALVEFVKTGKLDFSSLVDSIIADMARIAVRKTIMEPFTKMLEGFDFTKLFSGFASGGVVKSPSLSAYSNGVYGPGEQKFFKFAKGGALGTFAEQGAGYEAIMPLSRGADGKLGVQSSGAGDVTVNVYNETKAQVTTESKTDVNGMRMISMFIKNEMQSAFKNGSMDSLLGQTYGLARQGSR